eukprot:m.1096501 g.1096501  ORF g.1096501 m.1096501 type:complete len:113 (-) comp24309_c1_seq6:188-526(-)
MSVCHAPELGNGTALVFGMTTSVLLLFLLPFVGYRAQPCCDARGSSRSSHSIDRCIPFPRGVRWQDNTVGENGWTYAVDFTGTYSSHYNKLMHFVRRRRWVRRQQRSVDSSA